MIPRGLPRGASFEQVRELVITILTSTQVLENKLGAIVIQLQPSFKLDIKKVDRFLKFFSEEVKKQEYKFFHL